MVEPIAKFLELSPHDQHLKRLFDRVREEGVMVVKVGEDEFVLQHRRATISDDARKRLVGGGPET